MNEKKKELLIAENMFNLDATPYPALSEIEAEMEKLTAIYAIYREFKDFEELQSITLWGDLNTDLLESGITELEKKCKKFKIGKDTPTFKAVEGAVGNFKESIPLIINLKNDAMKVRHWEKLMEVTGVTFDMNPKTLTLENIFAMELSNF